MFLHGVASKCCVLVLLSLLTLGESKYGFVTWSYGKAQVSITDNSAEIPNVHIARATFTNEINLTGWAFLELHTTAGASDEKQAYAAGFLEGFLTRDLIWMHWQNVLKGYCYNKTEVCGMIEDFVDKNEDYIASMIAENPIDPYWYQMKLYYIQIEGLAVGYNQATSDAYEWLTVRDIIWLNMLGDLDDLAFALSMPRETPEGLMFGEHCSGLVKLLPDLSNLYTSHVTWNSYQSMLRFQKMYVLNYKVSPDSDELIPGRKMSFTSYPGFVQSTDDFYIISSGLVTAETTIGNSNRTLFENVKPIGQNISTLSLKGPVKRKAAGEQVLMDLQNLQPSTSSVIPHYIMEYARAMVANRLARDGKQWADAFRRHNSGTYNNQWYVVDYNKFKASKGQIPGVIKLGLLWVVEQLPGNTEAADLTEHLKATSYFPSYNIPYFPRIFNLSGGNDRVATFGDWFGYHTNPRAKIFHKKQAGINNVRDMFTVMRYNDFKHDPLARCECHPPYSACNAIAARNDLNPANGTYPFRALGHRSHGATDAKVTSATLRRSYQFLSVASPTYNISRGIPPFRWSEFDMGPHISHVGHPDLWMFPPILHRWEWG